MGDAAMIPVSMVRKTVVWSGALTQMLSFANTFVQRSFLPIYFQAVKGASPLMAGVYMLPSVLSQILSGVSSGFLSRQSPFDQHHIGRSFANVFASILVGKLGYYLPWMLAASVIASVGVGFLSGLKPDTPTGVWIGLQIISGFGRGLGVQVVCVYYIPHSQLIVSGSVAD